MAGGSVGWGIVGFGWVARDYMAPAILAAGHRVAAVYDPSPAAREAAELIGARGHASLEALAHDDDVEAVYVATPNHLHREAVEVLARAGKAILCEKPMAAHLDDAEAMARACRQAGVLYGTAFDQRHHPAHRALRALVRDGSIGTVTAVRIVYACWVDVGWATDNWRIDAAKAGGGALMDLAPHGLDLVDFLLGEPVEDLAALMQARVQDYAVDDGAMLIGRTRSGVLASLHVAYNMPETLPRRRLEVTGTHGQLVAVDTMGQDPGGTLTRTDAATGLAEPVPVPDEGASPFVNQALAFSLAVRAGEQHGFSLGRDLHTMRLLAWAYGHAPAEAMPA